jgi:hypothetical protein
MISGVERWGFGIGLWRGEEIRGAGWIDGRKSEELEWRKGIEGNSRATGTSNGNERRRRRTEEVLFRNLEDISQIGVTRFCFFLSSSLTFYLILLWFIHDTN